MYFSFIIPVYNRPDELDELLNCISKQTNQNFEIVIIEDGSTLDSASIVQKYESKGLTIQYLVKSNEGQGFARNDGFKIAKGDFFIILDSDALIEPNYLETVVRELNAMHLDLYGGPDKDHPSFTPIQKAISYSMTSIFTTGGIGEKNQMLAEPFIQEVSTWVYPERSMKLLKALKLLEWAKISNLVYDVSLSDLLLD